MHTQTHANTYLHTHTLTFTQAHTYIERDRERQGARQTEGRLAKRHKEIYLKGMAQVRKTYIEFLCS